MNENEEKQMRTVRVMKTIITVVVLLGVALVMFTGNIRVEFGTEALTVSGSMAGSADVAYSEIQSVTLEEGLAIGTRTFGVGSVRLQAGQFSNTAFGDYQLFSYSDCHTYVVVKTADGVVVFNAKTVEETQTLYSQLQAKLA